ncbi:hypothetical protein HO133_006368 [Letharia lupina]|uniref:Uncharacterized protein n=1 Tax=Letharia lupina TaxID=560253 RepID=A0A8H6F7L9_9LECA|nr:uncharacterized protein HO133_006368 [Letharia lupina]KAF6217956.1 hypothetical protein HO133_006368 [Letharia lupina]
MIFHNFMHLRLGPIVNVPRCNFHIVLVALGTKTNAFAAEKTNIAVKDSITVKRSPLSGWPCTIEAEPGTRAAFPAPGHDHVHLEVHGPDGGLEDTEVGFGESVFGGDVDEE